MKRYVFYFLIAIFMGISALNFYRVKFWKKEEIEREQPKPVEVVRVSARDIDIFLEEIGDVKGIKEVDVTPKINGEIIKDIYVDVGDFVKKGDTIAVLDRSSIEKRVEEAREKLRSAEATVSKAKADLDVARKDYERYKNLLKARAISKQYFEHIEARFKVALENYRLAMSNARAAKAALDRLLILFNDYEIKAPIGGYIVKRYVDPGERSSINIPIVRISREDRVKVIVQIPETFFSHLRKGMRASVYVDAYPGREFEGRISRINPSVDPKTRNFTTEIIVENTGGLLHSGMFARVKIDVGKSRFLTLPMEAVNKIPGSSSYYVFSVENNTAVLKNVKVTMRRGRIVGVEGLKEGELIVIKGISRLKDGDRVKIVSEYKDW